MQAWLRGPYDDGDDAPAIEVRVYRHGALVRREWCESEEQAALVVDAWSELDGVECEVDDLTTRHRPGDILEPAPAELREEDYPEAPGPEAERRRYE
jgi:hypothetical protein